MRTVPQSAARTDAYTGSRQSHGRYTCQMVIVGYDCPTNFAGQTVPHKSISRAWVDTLLVLCLLSVRYMRGYGIVFDGKHRNLQVTSEYLSWTLIFSPVLHHDFFAAHECQSFGGSVCP